jgi:UDP-N-acetylmuramoyl-L-alanyl-D-glutamate--2,6-diaminopimelate ligase
MPDEVTLGDLARALGADPPAEAEILVSDVHHDSRAVTAGSVFVAIAGEVSDGHAFVAAAEAAGAVAVVVERPTAAVVSQIVVDDSRRALAAAADLVHGHASRRLRVVGVTGTNGKTSVTHMVEGVMRTAGVKTGLIGTLGARIDGDPVTVPRTTPESSDLQRLLGRMAEAGIDVAAIEVSSHALDLHRVDGVAFAAAAFTNLSQDHLDFHGDMESYYASKRGLFLDHEVAIAVVAVDDEWGRRLVAELDRPVVTASVAESASVFASGVSSRASQSSFALHSGGRSAEVTLPLPARFSVANAVTSAALCLELGLGLDEVCAGLEALDPIPGRFELVSGDWPFATIVDYAHTPEAVRAAVAEARRIAGAHVIAVVGAGGDRDQHKRPLMGEAAASADLTVVTSDNPRSEDPTAIIAEVVAGIPRGAAYAVEVDRRVAIRTAVSAAGDGDIVLVLGKGHEQGQDFGDRVEPFDDRVVVREEAASIAAGASP